MEQPVTIITGSTFWLTLYSVVVNYFAAGSQIFGCVARPMSVVSFFVTLICLGQLMRLSLGYRSTYRRSYFRVQFLIFYCCLFSEFFFQLKYFYAGGVVFLLLLVIADTPHWHKLHNIGAFLCLIPALMACCLSIALEHTDISKRTSTIICLSIVVLLGFNTAFAVFRIYFDYRNYGTVNVS